MSALSHQHEYGKESSAYGPFAFLNPTTRRVSLQWQNTEKTSAGNEVDTKDAEKSATVAQLKGNAIGATEVHRRWRSRDNRKGRHTIVLSPDATSNTQYITPPSTSTPRAIFRGIGRMITHYPIWDVSYLVAIIFTLGSIVWCINAFFVWLPLQDPSTEFSGEIADAGGISAFVGATIFEIGSALLMVEAVNENRSDCFGWAVEKVLEEEGVLRFKEDVCSHHHGNRHNLVGRGKRKEKGSEAPNLPKSKSWIWFPSLFELRTHYLREIGFLACCFQMAGATIFWISGFTALPPIYNRLSTTADQNGAYWLPQVIGGTGFIISGLLFMLETQKKWYVPAINVLGWHIGAWNLIGGIGFTLCGALGFAARNSGAVYQGSLATFWGSWCFLIGSVIQWYESLDKHPVDVEKVDNKASVEP